MQIAERWLGGNHNQAQKLAAFRIAIGFRKKQGDGGDTAARKIMSARKRTISEKTKGDGRGRFEG